MTDNINNTELFKWAVISSDSNRFELRGLYHNMYDNVIDYNTISLHFNELKDDIYEDMPLIWDNSIFIEDTFHHFLIRYESKNLNAKDYIEFADIMYYLDDTKVSELIYIIETAKESGWFNNTIDSDINE